MSGKKDPTAGDKFGDPDGLSDYYREKASELRKAGKSDEADSYDRSADSMDQISANQKYNAKH